jgi:hypothetical protein
MPRFHMHIRHADKLLEDWEGEEFPSLVEARTEAVMAARELMAAEVASGKKPTPKCSSFEIVDESGRIVLVVPFEEAID